MHWLHYFHFQTSFIFEGDSVLWFQGSSQETLRFLSIPCFNFHFGKMFYFMMLSFNWKDDFWLHRFETNCCFLNFLISAFSFGEINEFVLVRVELPTPLNSLKVGELEDNRQSKKMLKWVSKSRWRHTIT